MYQKFLQPIKTKLLLEDCKYTNVSFLPLCLINFTSIYQKYHGAKVIAFLLTSNTVVFCEFSCSHFLIMSESSNNSNDEVTRAAYEFLEGGRAAASRRPRRV